VPRSCHLGLDTLELRDHGTAQQQEENALLQLVGSVQQIENELWSAIPRDRV